MILKSELQSNLVSQIAFFQQKNSGLERDTEQSIDTETTFILVITGVRRAGKSTLLFQIAKNLKSSPSFLNFESPTLFDFETSDFSKLIDLLQDYKHCFFDEIQNVNNWEIFIRTLHDQEKKICITGSNASLLSKELGTRLTGRHLQIELFPFSYSEFIRFKKIKPNENSLTKYLNTGGFPEYVKTPKREILQQLLKDIVYRDIVVRYGIRNSDTFLRICLFLISNVAKEYSINSLTKTFDVGSATSVMNYINWLEDSYLIFSLPRFSWSLKSIAKNRKKVYAIDTGFIKANTLSSSKDDGRLLENLVYLHLRRQYKELYYFKEKGECDFVVKEYDTIKAVYQVCYDLNEDNKHREINGLKEAMAFFDLNYGTILTLDQEDKLILNNKTIQIIPIWKWMTN